MSDARNLGQRPELPLPAAATSAAYVADHYHSASKHGIIGRRIDTVVADRFRLRRGLVIGRGCRMAAMKPRTGDGPLEVTKEGRGIVMRVPLEGGGRLVVELSVDEAAKLGDALQAAVG
jgi:Protein of unknown function (DUF3117)